MRYVRSELPSDPPGRLSIGELAGLAGVSPRAVRHYHAIGLLPEPARDGSGYRRYGGKDVVALVRVVAVVARLPKIPSGPSYQRFTQQVKLEKLCGL